MQSSWSAGELASVMQGGIPRRGDRHCLQAHLCDDDAQYDGIENNLRNHNQITTLLDSSKHTGQCFPTSLRHASVRHTEASRLFCIAVTLITDVVTEYL